MTIDINTLYVLESNIDVLEKGLRFALSAIESISALGVGETLGDEDLNGIAGDLQSAINQTQNLQAKLSHYKQTEEFANEYREAYGCEP